jgi:hypothetical protein
MQVLAINQLSKFMMTSLVAYEKPHTLGHQQSSAMVKLFMAQLFNTAVLVLVLNADEVTPWILTPSTPAVYPLSHSGNPGVKRRI